MRFEKIAIATLAACGFAAASDDAYHGAGDEDAPTRRGLSSHDPLLRHSDGDYIHSSSFFSNEDSYYDTEATKYILGHPPKVIKNSVPLNHNPPLDDASAGITTTTNQMGTSILGAPDLGILGEKLTSSSSMMGELEASSSRPSEGNAMVGGRNLDGTTTTTTTAAATTTIMDCEAYCAPHSRPVVELTIGYALNSVIRTCASGGECPYGDVPINCWNLSKVTSLTETFYWNKDFNQPLNCWDVSRVTHTKYMFGHAEAFNQPINEWNVSRVVNTHRMFWDAKAFNQPINEWDVSKVTSTEFMFDEAYSFNQPLDEWNVSRVTSMYDMFSFASAFNQCLMSWEALTLDREVKIDGLFASSGCEYSTLSISQQGIWCNRDCSDPVCNNDDFFRLNGKNNRDCNWAAKKPGKRCRKKDKTSNYRVKAFCPLACDLRCSCNNSKKSFKLDGDGKVLKCKKVKKKEQCNQGATSKKLWGTTVADFCPRKCDSCLP
eukprot:CAMPEP_0172399710 /NCGR_PEP_ID=MMETSP1061-20121228/42446_1 /TAXON_ID=37318 /ORGANISM="Pseudo-nitzschia pungens, Strain cf. pungens" /LENGTH=490 /DNA_ID=CAMNT_0013132695 /DNA_START=105 /DNA_END=1577 /DNA_ORIENTATION=-